MVYFLILALLCAIPASVEAQDRHDWQSLAQLQAGDNIRLSLKTGPVTGLFQSWTPQQVTAGTTTAQKEDVLKIERYRHGVWGRGKTAAVGALIGFGAGFGIGAGLTGCDHNQLGICVSRGFGGAIFGGAGAVVGAGIGALLPHHNKDLIYSVK
ncbi:MAG: hypothetical protein ABSE86_02180 [Bryobacteraceae bacterium]|jgi:hypothetical protein